MATFSRQTVKLVAALSSLPALGISSGLSLSSVCAEEKTAEDSKTQKRVYKASELPLYKTANDEKEAPVSEVYPRNEVERQIGVARKALWDTASSFQDTYESVQDTVSIGVEHSKSTIEYVQNNPGELPRVVFIAVAGMGGVVLGYRGGILRKILYSSIAVGSSGALCYPKTTVELSYAFSDQVSEVWKDIGGQKLVEDYWPFGDKKEDQKVSKPPVPELLKDGEKGLVRKDIGQSNPKDKDMYSTRGS